MKEFSAFIRGALLVFGFIELYVLGLNELPVNLWDVLAENNLDISVF